MKGRKKAIVSRREKLQLSIQSIIMLVLMVLTFITISVMSLLLYHRFKLAIEKNAVANTEATVESVVDRVNSDLLDIRQIFNAANYNIVQEFDISSQEFQKQFSLLYETNSDKIQSVALYGRDGKLITAEPVSAEMQKMQLKIYIFQNHIHRICLKMGHFGIIELYH